MSDGAAPNLGPPSSDNPGALELAMRDSARSLAKWAAILFSLFIVTDTLLFAPPVDRILPAFDAVLAIVYAATWLAASRGLLPARHAGNTAAGILLAVLPYLMTLLWLTGQPLQSTALALWQVGCGLFLLSWPWLGVLLLISDAAWLFVVLRLPASPEWAQYAVLLLSANLLALVAHGIRLRVYRRLDQLRSQDAARRRELEAALLEAGKVGEMRRLSELKTRFLNVAAHELATPMTPILIQMRLLRGMEGRMPPEARRSMDTLDRNLERLNRLLRDILDGSRVQADKLPMTLMPLDLAAVVADCQVAYGPVANERGVVLTLDAAPSPVHGDPARLTQVLTNLVSNAIKFTGRGGHVRVTVGPTLGAGARVEVRDEGLGFDPEQANLLFQPFSQLHEQDPSRRGTGLGLYICKGIVERHGGTMGASSPGPNKGATFWFELPPPPT